MSGSIATPAITVSDESGSTNGNRNKVDELSIAMDRVSVSSLEENLCSKDRSLSSLSTLDVKKKLFRAHDIDAVVFSQEPWICKADSVRHRLRGILITHDTYDLFRLSFKSDHGARSFLGELLVAMSTSGSIIRMSELQLEELNSDWDETARSIHPQFEPVNLPVLTVFEETYSLSSRWEIVKTLYYIALSQEILDTLYEDAICNLPLNPLDSATCTPMVKEVPYLRPSEQRCSAELELERALEYSSSLKRKDDPPVSTIVKRLIGLTMVGRRERSEPFLNLSEITIPRLLPRESIGNLCQAIKFVRFRKYDPNKTPQFETRGMRVFLFRRPVGRILKHKLEEVLAELLKETTTVCTLVNKGKAPKLQLDSDADELLDCVHKSMGNGIAEKLFLN